MDVQLTGTESTINLTERINSQLQLDVSGMKEVSNRLGTMISNAESKVKLIGDDFDQLDLEFEELQTLEENTDNNLRNLIYNYRG